MSPMDLSEPEHLGKRFDPFDHSYLADPYPFFAEARLIRRGRSLAYLEAYLYSEGSPEPVAHATSSFAYRFPAQLS